MPEPIPPWVITCPFGTAGAWAAGYHTGDDYSTRGRIGVAVLATHEGLVLGEAYSWGAAYGIHVITWGRWRRIRVGYAHLSDAVARPGEHVRVGDLIGYSGNTGRTTGPHLHYEERRAPYRYSDHRKPRFNRR
jgi:murein DD-endopeptidase MepM/ murein hydrolase activator NlpD